VWTRENRVDSKTLSGHRTLKETHHSAGETSVKLNYRLLVAVAVCILLLSAALVLAVRTRTHATQPSPQGNQQGAFEAERVTLREWGFEPKEIKREPGPFFLILQNQSGLPEVELTLVSESGNQHRRFPDTRNALQFRQRIELPPGTYFIKESGHPDWQCQITIGK
jgi:hypothetical protein